MKRTYIILQTKKMNKINYHYIELIAITSINLYIFEKNCHNYIFEYENYEKQIAIISRAKYNINSSIKEKLRICLKIVCKNCYFPVIIVHTSVLHTPKY